MSDGSIVATAFERMQPEKKQDVLNAIETLSNTGFLDIALQISMQRFTQFAIYSEEDIDRARIETRAQAAFMGSMYRLVHGEDSEPAQQGVEAQ